MHTAMCSRPYNGGPPDNLFAHIDRSNVVALNSDHGVRKYLGSYSHDRLLMNDVRQHDSIIHVPFTGSVNCVRSLKSGPGDQTPAKVALFVSVDNFDFEDAADKELLQTSELTSPNLADPQNFRTSLPSLFFSASQGAETTRIYYVGFLGQRCGRKQERLITVYEFHANIADHEKIQGTEGNFSFRTEQCRRREREVQS
ncbi:DUF1000-domain-containing protein [Lactarius sanguifluus]|nr:DUF1000-domain-containing protein [Lactarius sanguifluus]